MYGSISPRWSFWKFEFGYTVWVKLNGIKGFLDSDSKRWNNLWFLLKELDIIGFIDAVIGRIFLDLRLFWLHIEEIAFPF